MADPVIFIAERADSPHDIHVAFCKHVRTRISTSKKRKKKKYVYPW